MKFHSELLAQLWVNNLREVSHPGTLALKDWCRDGIYSVASIPSTTEFNILVHTELEFFRPLAFEVNRWASAAFETVGSIATNTVRPRAIAWPLIQLYYASFFSAHCLLRVFGRAATQLDSQHTSRVVATAHAQGLGPPSLNTGLYRLTYDPTLKILSGSKLNEPHADTWKIFSSLIQTLSNDILSTVASTAVRNEASLFLNSLREVMRNGGRFIAGNWLSFFRNQVNYHKSFGVWYPYARANPQLREVLRLTERWREHGSSFNLDINQSDVDAFIEAATCIIWLCRESVLLLSKSRIKSDLFLDRGGLDFLKMARWHTS